MTYPFTDTWAPWHDVAFLLAATLVVLGVVGLVRLVTLWREARRLERSRWDAWLDRMWAEASDLYRDDPMGGRVARWEPRCAVCLDRAEFADGRCVCEVSR